MKIFGMGGIELVIILIVVLLIFGPKNLPKLGSALGKTMSNLRSGMNEGKKKNEKMESDDTESASAEKVAPDAIQGHVESVEEVTESASAAVVQEPDQESGQGSEQAFAQEQKVNSVSTAEMQSVASEPEATTEAPKKVRRVVKKKVSSE